MWMKNRFYELRCLINVRRLMKTMAKKVRWGKFRFSAGLGGVRGTRIDIYSKKKKPVKKIVKRKRKSDRFDIPEDEDWMFFVQKFYPLMKPIIEETLENKQKLSKDKLLPLEERLQENDYNLTKNGEKEGKQIIKEYNDLRLQNNKLNRESFDKVKNSVLVLFDILELGDLSYKKRIQATLRILQSALYRIKNQELSSLKRCLGDDLNITETKRFLTLVINQNPDYFKETCNDE